LAIKVLSKTMDSTTLTSEKCKSRHTHGLGWLNWLFLHW
jgi:hypothetical protein